MKTPMRILTLLAFSLTLAACGGEPEAPAEGEAAASEDVQTVEITAGPNGYAPEAVTLEAGRPVRLIFTRTVESDCLASVSVPAFGVEQTPLPLNEPVAITFMPGEAGRFEMVCGMGMQDGTLVVKG